MARRRTRAWERVECMGGLRITFVVAVNVDAWPDVTDEEENMRSASRKRLIRRIAPLLACVPR